MPTFKDRQTDLGRRRTPAYTPATDNEHGNVESNSPVQPRPRRRLGKLIVVLVFLYGFALMIGDVFDFDLIEYIDNLVRHW